MQGAWVQLLVRETWSHMLQLDLVQPNKYFKKSQKESTYLASTIMSIQFRTMRTLLKPKFLEASQGPTLQAALSNDSSQICCVTSFPVRLDTLQIWQNWPFYANIRMTEESNNRPHKYYKTYNFVSFYYLSTEKKMVRFLGSDNIPKQTQERFWMVI